MNHDPCPICGYGEPAGDACPRCGADLTGASPEETRMEAPGTFTTEDKQFFGKLSTNATFYLTDRRLVAVPEKLEGHGLSMALTAAAVNKLTSAYGVVSLPLERITAVRDGKFGLLGKAIIVDTDGGDLLKITVAKQAQWKAALQAAVAEHR